MRLWRINLKPGSKPGIDAAEFCVRERVVGVGWKVAGTPATPDDYWALGKQQHYPTRKRKWSACVKPLLYTMQPSDLVWTRNRKGTYYLGRIAGPWEYKSAPEFTDADIINVRPCEWACAGAPDAVPGPVITSFIPRRTVQPVNDPSALLYSRYLFARLRSQPFAPHPGGAKADILELLAPDDLEDVAALYLQVERGCVRFPSTCKSDTMAVECVLAAVADGRRVGLQVKRGTSRSTGTGSPSSTGPCTCSRPGGDTSDCDPRQAEIATGSTAPDRHG